MYVYICVCVFLYKFLKYCCVLQDIKLSTRDIIIAAAGPDFPDFLMAIIVETFHCDQPMLDGAVRNIRRVIHLFIDKKCSNPKDIFDIDKQRFFDAGITQALVHRILRVASKICGKQQVYIHIGFRLHI